MYRFASFAAHAARESTDQARPSFAGQRGRRIDDHGDYYGCVTLTSPIVGTAAERRAGDAADKRAGICAAVVRAGATSIAWAMPAGAGVRRFDDPGRNRK
jgi:hypothetical protein